MKLVLINPRNRVSLYGDYLWEPLALGYVAAATPPHWDVEFIDAPPQAQEQPTASVAA